MQIDYSKRIFGLDLMRAVAIMMVVLSHTLWITPTASGMIPDLLRIAGLVGVEIFFVLSGFLIGRIVYRMYISEEFGFNNVLYFWIRRWFRTLPNYYLALLLNILIASYIGIKLPNELWQYPFFLQNFGWEMPAFFIESWSLSIEEFAYILGPLMLYLTLFLKTSISKSKLFLWVTLFIILLFTLAKFMYNLNDSIQTMTHWNVNVKAIVIYRIDTIYYGVLAAYISIVKPNFWKQLRFLAFILGVFLFLGLNAAIPLKRIFIETYSQFWNVWYLPINSIAILLVLPLLSQIQSAPKVILKPITYLSLISYGMYLLHYSIVLQLLKYYIPTDDISGLDIFVYILVYLLLTIVLSFLLYRFYEKPLTDLRDKAYFKKKIKT